MRSVAVVLPASMCAMIPIFRQRFSGMLRATISFLSRAGTPAVNPVNSVQRTVISSDIRGGHCSLSTVHSVLLPAVVCKRAVGFRHPVHVFLLFHGRAA